MRVFFPPEIENALKEQFFGGARSGFFVEVGANEPEHLSQTFHLERLGWNGILVEPQPHLGERLRQRRTAKVYAVACSSPHNAGSFMTLYLAGPHSSLHPHAKVAAIHGHETMTVPVMTLDEVLSDAQAPVPIDFLSIDVEGHEIQTLQGLDLARWRPRLLLVEDITVNVRLHRYLRAQHYKWVRRTGYNSWYVPAETPMRIGLVGWLQFFRKYYLGAPFHHARRVLQPPEAG